MNWSERPRVVLPEQTLCIPPRATTFRAVCEACASAQLPSRGYVGSTVDGRLPLEATRGSLVCPRGHRIRIVRATPEAAVR
jgi:hypothetical protein